MAIVSISVQQTSGAYTRPNDNGFSQMSDSQLAKEFGNNFQAFKDPKTGNATADKIREVAGRPLTGDAQKDKETQLAQEVLQRDRVLNSLDSVDDNGKRDGIIGPWNPGMAAGALSSKPCNCIQYGNAQVSAQIYY